MRVRDKPDPFNHHEMASLILREAVNATRRIKIIAEDLGQWGLTEPRSSWVPSIVIYGDRYGERDFDTAVRFVFRNHPNLLRHWERSKAQPRDAALIADVSLEAAGLTAERDLSDGLVDAQADQIAALQRIATPNWLQKIADEITDPSLIVGAAIGFGLAAVIGTG